MPASLDQLSEPERALLRRLSVFRGGWTLDAAQAVVADGGADAAILPRSGVKPLLERALQNSLVGQHAAAPLPRYSLAPALDANAARQLAASGEADAVRARHLAYFCGLADEAEKILYGPPMEAWQDRLQLENENLNAALEYAQTHKLTERALQLGGALAQHWVRSGAAQEAQVRLSELLAGADETIPVWIRARAFSAAGTLAWANAGYRRAYEFHEIALGLYRRLNDPHGIGFTLHNMGAQLYSLGRVDQSLALEQQALDTATAAQDRYVMLLALNGLGLEAHRRGDSARARELMNETLRVAREMGESIHVAIALLNLSEFDLADGRLDAALAEIEEAVQLQLAGSDLHMLAGTWPTYGLILLRLGRLDAAAEKYQVGLRLAAELKHAHRVADCAEGLAGVLARRGEYARAARLLAAGDSLRSRTASQRDPVNVTLYAELQAEVKARLTPDALDDEIAAGEILKLDQVAALGLEE